MFMDNKSLTIEQTQHRSGQPKDTIAAQYDREVCHEDETLNTFVKELRQQTSKFQDYHILL